jgi:hypothetical protein
VGIAQRQSTVTPEQRERARSRLVEWTQLSVEERELARRNYQQLRALPPDQRQDVARRWSATRVPSPGSEAPATESSGQAQP